MDGRNLFKELISVNILRAGEQPVSRWSGGTTTQLAIHPENAVYSERNFEWRLSTARVDSEQSTFTPLPGVRRVLMILEGEIELTHEGIRGLSLKPFGRDEFDGGWTTKSVGRCVDFNLMMVGCSGELSPVITQSLNLFERDGVSEAWEAFYCLSAMDTTVGIQDEVFTSKLNKGDFLLIHAKPGFFSGFPRAANFSHSHGHATPAAVRATVYK